MGIKNRFQIISLHAASDDKDGHLLFRRQLQTYISILSGKISLFIYLYRRRVFPASAECRPMVTLDVDIVTCETCLLN